MTCNAADLTIHSLRVADEEVPADGIQLCPEAETLSFGLKSPLKAGSEVKMHVHFKGILNDKMKGFYRSKYTSPDGKDHYIATTQFEATDARR